MLEYLSIKQEMILDYQTLRIGVLSETVSQKNKTKKTKKVTFSLCQTNSSSDVIVVFLYSYFLNFRHL